MHFLTTACAQSAIRSRMTGWSRISCPQEAAPLTRISRNGWSVTSVDTLSTAILMEDEEIVNQILKYIPKIDFTTTKAANQGISVFETTIRYLGGLISSKA